MKTNEMNELIKQAENVYHQWDARWAEEDIEGLLTLYADDIVIESPLIPYLLGKKEGVCKGKNELRKFLEIAAPRKPKNRRYYRTKFFTDGKTLMWEYPRLTDEGKEQMDFVEVMELEKGLIIRHRVYWGWLGFDIIKHDKYYR